METLAHTETPRLRPGVPVSVTQESSPLFGQRGTVIASGHRGFCYSVRFPGHGVVWIERTALDQVGGAEAAGFSA